MKYNQTAQFFTKVKHIFVPFVIIAICHICFLAFMYWLLVIKLNVYNVEDNFLYIFPMIISPWVPLFIWLRKRLKLLKLNTSGKRDPVTGIMMLNWVTIILPAFIAMLYMSTAIGKVTHLNYIGQIKDYPSTKYYFVDHYYIAKNFVHATRNYSISGKGNTDYNMHYYVCIPVFDNVFPDTTRVTAIRKGVDPKTLVFINKVPSTMEKLKKLPADSIRYMRYYNSTFTFLSKYGDAGKYGALIVYTRSYKFKQPPPVSKISPAAWLAVEYDRTISNRLAEIEKTAAFKNFGSEVNVQFKATDFNHFKYLSRLPNTRKSGNYTYAVTWRGDVTDDNPVILLPHYQRFEDRNGSKLAWIFGSFAIGCCLFLIILFCIPLKSVAKVRKSVKTESPQDGENSQTES
jgi:hypothetical protein